MLALERRNLILEKLQAEKRVVVSELSQLYDVSEETIRRDLDKLEKEGLAIKSYGGAVINEDVSIDLPFNVRKNQNVTGKQKMAELAASLVKDGDHIFLDASTTAVFVAKALKEKERLTKQIQRYIRLTELIPELLDLVDNKKLQFTVAVDISYIDKEVQEWIYEYISDTGFIKPKQIAALRNQLNDGPINQIQMLSIFNNCVMAKKVSRSLTFSEKKLTKYFPDDYTAKDMEQVIESLLEKWMQEQSC